MSDELKPVRCGCGGATRRCADPITGQWFVQCRACGTVALYYNSEAEAIEAWNRAMGTDARTLMKVFAYDATCAVCEKKKERTGKVEELEKRSETMISWEGKCSNCGAYTNHEMNYCFECGARLEWE